MPEAPFLFYRDAKGHFRWWSFRDTFAWLGQVERREDFFSVKEGRGSRDGVEILGPFLLGAFAIDSNRSTDLSLAAGAGRDVWISWRPLTNPAELAIARWAIVAGAAILVEPADRLHPELFAWARPTLVSGSAEELVALAAECERLSSGLFHRRWLRQRVERLRFLLVEVDDAPAAVAVPTVPFLTDQVGARWRALSPHFAAGVQALSSGSLV